MDARRLLLRSCTAIAMLGSIATLSPAQTIYRCVNAQGDITYQDKPCKADSKQTVEHFAPAIRSNPAEPPTSSFDALPPAPASNASAPPPIAEAAPPQPLPVPPPIWFCTRAEDGTRYVSHDGATPSRWVPAGIVGIPGKSLAETYGPGGGGGVSAPGVKKAPISTSPRDRVAANFIEVHDECEPGTLEQACEALRDELTTIEKKLPRAFNADRATLEPRRAELRHLLEGC